jgi:predicted  nucleic acid-binding Zn-ribbon protein
MTETNKKDSKRAVTISLIVALVALLGVLAFLAWQYQQKKTEVKEIVEMMEFEKEQLADEYEEFAIQFDGYQTTEIRNDSLVALLTQEQQRVQDLLEELRITKATNARRIAELKKELATVREVMVSYVHQIDSLDRVNKQLVQENQEVRQKYQVVVREAKQLEKERTQLAAVVSRASMLEVSRFEMIPLNKRDRKTTIYNQILKLQFDYTIAKNTTSKPGMKTLYMRITRPDGEVMQKNINDVFKFENKMIGYSVEQEFEYAGEELSGSLYWLVEEILQTGIYNADFFVDGELIGSFPFEISK